MKLAIASDHAGYELKAVLIEYLKSKGYDVVNLGTDSSDSVDYPDYGKAVGEYIASKKADLGIAICGTGVGISISANKVKGVRCACVSEPYSAKMTKLHNDANIFSYSFSIVRIIN